MKKLIVISLIAILGLTGCGYKKGETMLGDNFTVKSVENDENSIVCIIVDKKSGVNYYFIQVNQGLSLTPIYDKDGKVVIDKVEQE